jgi:DNA mismatch repair protein MutL
MLAVSKKDAQMEINGYIGTPTFAKRNRSYQTTIINGRFVDGGVVADAANSAFLNFITTGSFPFFVLELSVDTASVDVNVHPRKSVVKFSQTDEIQKFVESAVTEALDKHLLQKHKTDYNPADDDEMRRRMAFFQTDDTCTVKSADHIMHIFDLQDRPIVRPEKKPVQEQMDTAVLPKYRIVGTIFNTYILLETTDAFHIVDQHAAHERILYDRLTKQIDTQRVEQQRLIDFGVLVMSSEEMTKMDAAATLLNECGLECAPFGTNCYRFTAVPTIIAVHGIDTFLDQLFIDVRNTSIDKISTLLRDKIITQCCRSAIKAGHSLPNDEIKALINAALDGKTRPTCPHGRPIIIGYTKSQIEKMFARK